MGRDRLTEGGEKRFRYNLILLELGNFWDDFVENLNDRISNAWNGQEHGVQEKNDN